MKMKTVNAAVAAIAVAIYIPASSMAMERGLVAHFTFDDAAQFGYDKVQKSVIGTIASTNYHDPASVVEPASCDAPIVRGMNFSAGWYQSTAMTVPGDSFGSASGIPYGNQDVTYSVWIKPSTRWQDGSTLGMGSKCFLLRHGNPSHEWWTTYDHQYIYIQKDGTTGYPQIVFAVGESTKSASSAIYSHPGNFDGNWHFIAAAYSNNVLKIYFDGQPVAEKILSSGVNVPDNSPLVLGATCTTWNDYVAYHYSGSVDELRVYNRVLAPEEILAAYNAGAAAFDTDVISWTGAASGGAAEDGDNWGTMSNRRTSDEIYEAGSVLDITDVNDGGVIVHGVNETLKLKGVICTNGQDEVALRIQSGRLSMRRPSTQRGLVAHLSFDGPSELTYDSGVAGLTATTNVSIHGSTTEAVPIHSMDGVDNNAMCFPENGEWGYYASPYLKTDSAVTTKANGIPCGADAVSYSVWIKPLAAQKWNNGMYGLADNLIWLFRRGAWGNGNATYLWLSKGAGGGKLWWSIANYIESDGTCSYEPSNLFDGNWHHVVCTYESKELAMYYDGMKVATCTSTYSLNVSDGSSISLGFSGAANEYTHRYLGGFDEFKIFNVALTDEEVAAEYAQRSQTLDTVPVGTVPSPVRVQLDAGTSAEVLGYGHEYGSMAGVGSMFVGPASELKLDGTFALDGVLTGCGAVTVANLKLGGQTSAYTGDFTICENARIMASDDAGNMFSSTFGGKVVLPKKAVVTWGLRPERGSAFINAASFVLPSDFTEWTDTTGKKISVKVTGNQLKITACSGFMVVVF